MLVASATRETAPANHLQGGITGDCRRWQSAASRERRKACFGSVCGLLKKAMSGYSGMERSTIQAGCTGTFAQRERPAFQPVILLSL
jgi:hypothetical protein